MSTAEPPPKLLPLPAPEPGPSWRVVSFIDPSGAGADLAYTEGLSAFELPELLLWARPTEGHDPGADWVLTHRERGRLLNRWAVEMLTGRLVGRDRREERFDGGHTVASFRFGRPATAAHLHHPHLPPTTKVLSVAWSLIRRAHPVGDEAPLRPAAARRLERWISTAEAMTQFWQLRPGATGLTEVMDGTRASLLPGHLSALSIGSPSHGRFGPATRWVDARIAQVLAADANVIAGFLDRLQLAERAHCGECLLDDVARLATRSQRNSACREASRAAQELALAVVGWPEHSSSIWGQTVAMARVEPNRHPTADPTVQQGLRVRLSDGLEVLLLTAVLADVAPPSLIAAGCGPWEWAVSDGRLPGRQWLAAPKIRRAARQLLATASPRELYAAVERAEQSQEHPVVRVVDDLVAGLQTTAAASAQPGSLLRRDQRHGLPRMAVRSADRLAGQLVTAMALPHRLPPESWQILRLSLQSIAPALPNELPAEVP